MITILILAATGLLAAPVGASVADKPTRKRLIKIAASKRKPRYQVPQIMMPVGVQKNDRTTDLEARAKWEDAMKWCSLKDLPTLEASIDKKLAHFKMSESSYFEAKRRYDELPYHRHDAWSVMYDLERAYKEAKWRSENLLTDDEKEYQRLVNKYGRYCIRNEMVLFDTKAIAA